MITQSEARQRLALNHMSMSKRDGEYRVAYAELHGEFAERTAYYTDDLDDAVLTGARMRRNTPFRQSAAA